MSDLPVFLVILGDLIESFGGIVLVASWLATVVISYRIERRKVFWMNLCLPFLYSMYYVMEKMKHKFSRYLVWGMYGGLGLILFGYIISEFSMALVGYLFIQGLLKGCIYALMAFGLILIFKTTDLVNFAQASMTMVVTFLALTFIGLEWQAGVSQSAGSSVKMWLLALPAAGLFGILTERILIRPLRNEPLISQIIATMGFALFIEGIGQGIWGTEEYNFPAQIGIDISMWSGWQLSSDLIFAAFWTVILITGLALFFKYTLVGVALRATAQNLVTARLMGINTSLVFMLSWAVAMMLAVIAGVFYVTGTEAKLNIAAMGPLMIKAFSAAVLGGFTSLPGAVVGGLILGATEAVVAFVAPDIASIYPFLLIILVLIVKPNGLFGHFAQKKV
jgi:branched-chain amino acid transport system permease protein